jgi:hypothetical protein
MRKTHKVIDKNGYSFYPDDTAKFIGTPEECAAWIAEQENPEWYKVTTAKAEEDRRSMKARLFGDADIVLDGRDEKVLDTVLKMKADYDKRLDKSAESAAEFMENFVNNFSCPKREFIKLMSNKHRTLQQSFTKLCLEWIETVASPEYTYDGRNEGSHRICKRLLDNSKSIQKICQKLIHNWAKKHPDDKEHMDEDMLNKYPPSTWLHMI